jgi:hypothetical protein
MGLMAAAIVLAGTVGSGMIALLVEGDAVPLGILTLIGGSVAAFLFVLSAPGIVGGIGLLKLKPWARYLVLILGVFNLFNFPVGTLVGIYTLVVLLLNKTAELFA